MIALWTFPIGHLLSRALEGAELPRAALSLTSIGVGGAGFAAAAPDTLVFRVKLGWIGTLHLLTGTLQRLVTSTAAGGGGSCAWLHLDRLGLHQGFESSVDPLKLRFPRLAQLNLQCYICNAEIAMLNLQC